MTAEKAPVRMRVPGAMRRLGRDRARLIAVVLLAVVTLSAAGIQSAAASILQHTLDANWRGAYDILVTAKGSHPPSNGLLPTNALSSGKRMPLAAVATIRSIEGIDVAAPIGEVQAAQLRYGFPLVSVPKGVAGASEVPQAFTVTTRLTTNDGLGERLVSSTTNTVVIDETPKPPAPTSCTFLDHPVDVAKYPHLCAEVSATYQNAATVFEGSSTRLGGLLTDGVIRFPAMMSPVGSTRITLVDPDAERAILGKAGRFLAPLQSVRAHARTSAADMDRWATRTSSPFARNFVEQRKARASEMHTQNRFSNDPEIAKEYADFFAEYQVDQGASETVDENFVPLLTTSTGSAPLTMTATISALGPAPRTGGDVGSESFTLPQGTGTPVGTSTADASGLLNPFARGTVEVPWPGTDPDRLSLDPTYDVLSLNWLGAVGGMPTKPHSPTTLTGTGFARPVSPSMRDGGDPFAAKKSGTDAGLESVYSSVSSIGPMDFTHQNLVVPVGSFSTSQVAKLQSPESYVPLGAYQSAETTVERDGERMKMLPSVSGLGLVSPRTVAIAPIASAAAWGQKDPVSAIRVRVAGISAYTQDARERVASVAAAIRQLGFTATLVAGSSPTSVDLAVDNYAFGTTTADEKQRVGTLHGVRQQWSELGAAALADTAVSTSSLAVLGIALGGVILLLATVQVVSIPRRREAAGALRTMGWTSWRVRRWLAAEEINGVVLVVLAGVAAILLSGMATTPVLIAAATSVVALTSALAAIAGGARAVRSRTQTHTPMRPRRASANRGGARYGVTTTLRFGLRRARSQLPVSISQAAAIVLAGLSAAGVAEVFIDGRRSAGASLVARLTVDQAAVAQLLLGAVALVAGVALSLVVRRIVVARRAADDSALRAMGWSARNLRSARHAELGVIVVPAIVIAAELAWMGATATDPVDRTALVVVAVLAAALVSAALLVDSRKGTRS
ncbi:hypothetical protein [Lacisediminihabitans changchengi]|uniref:FtsX-like permease family protein n=1 Tax=Lacisediminihabitans changchengi TaxID=2787634 RepID=A0A934W2L5_9MICO|nr:hypothetical protein [Lacisediminihabitans changchengi]MBK4346951.1 hypothetical protein [Lacisediminihabitans changchengi]MBK4347926.1 hypothetical protein [Lacisediminihabitans changchengi]